MEKRTPSHILACPLIALFTILVGFGCATEGMLVEPVLDSPGHHVESGFKLMEKGRLADAGREFTFARQLDPKCSAAYRGMGLVNGLKGEFPAAFTAMDFAVKLSADGEEKVLAHEGFIRLYAMSMKKGWLRAAEKNFALARAITTDNPSVYYYMAVAYEVGGCYAEAEETFRKVIEINNGYIVETYEHLKFLRSLNQ